MMKWFKNLFKEKPLNIRKDGRCKDCPYTVKIVNNGSWLFPSYGLEVDTSTMWGCCKIQEQIKAAERIVKRSKEEKNDKA